MLRRQSLAPVFVILFGAALCALPATDTRAGNVTMQPSASGSAWTLTWPSSAGTNNYVLTTDGTGITSWTAPGGAAPASLSSLTAATTTNSIDSSNWAQTWKWGTLTTQTALTLTTSTMTTGTLLSLSNTATGAFAGTVLSISNSEAGGLALAVTGTSTFNGGVSIGTSSPPYGPLTVTSTALAGSGVPTFFDLTDPNFTIGGAGSNVDGLGSPNGLFSISGRTMPAGAVSFLLATRTLVTGDHMPCRLWA